MSDILLVDDEPIVRDTVGAILRRDGHIVVTAQSAAHALELLDCIVPDLIITDIMMPSINGLELAEVIKKEHPHTGIIAISGGGQYAELRDPAHTVLKAGHIDSFFMKPLEFTELKHSIDELTECP